MKLELSLAEVRNIFNSIQEQPSMILDILRVNIKEIVGRYLSELMKVELTQFLEREPYERGADFDGVNFPMRVKRSVEVVSAHVAIGVSLIGYRLVFGLQSSNKESASSWREFFKDLKKRGLKAEEVMLGVMDGLP